MCTPPPPGVNGAPNVSKLYASGGIDISKCIEVDYIYIYIYMCVCVCASSHESCNECLFLFVVFFCFFLNFFLVII